MDDFNKFLAYLSEHASEIEYDSCSKSEDVPVENRTISRDEWTLITKFTIRYSKALLRQYHEWIQSGQ